jgi:hypothetical protein
MELSIGLGGMSMNKGTKMVGFHYLCNGAESGLLSVVEAPEIA